MKSIFEYKDHLKFLNDRYNSLKKQYKHISHRFISKKLDLKSPSILTHILNGRMKISDKLLEKFIQIFKLTKNNAEYFRNIVHLNQSESEEEKIYNLNKHMDFIKLNAQIIEYDKFQLYSKWYYTVLRALVSCGYFTGDCKEIISYLIPPLKKSEAIKGINLLKKFGFIEKDKNGFLKPLDQIITTGTQKEATAVKNFHHESLKLAGDAMDNLPKEDREVSAVVISVSEETFKLVQDEVRKCRQNILKMAKSDHNPQKVYQLNFQSFPLSTAICKYNGKKKPTKDKIRTCLEICKKKSPCKRFCRELNLTKQP